MDPESAAKKPRAKISMQQKLDAITCLDMGRSVTEVAAHLAVDTTTVRKWRYNRAQIEQWCVNAKKNSNLKKRVNMKLPANENLDEALFVWFCMQRRLGIPISGSMIKSKALNFHMQMGGEGDFAASTGWLGNWKGRHGIRLPTVFSEKLSVDLSLEEEFTENLLEVIEEKRLTRDQVFNCSEVGFDYRKLPSKTLAARAERETSGFKKIKDRITVMACSNASGSLKLPLMAIGSSVKPKAWDMDSFPLFYRQQKCAWMDTKLFTEWFDIEFIPRVSKFLEEKGLPLRALLIIDDTPSSPPEKDFKQGIIRIIYSSPNFTSLMQQSLLEKLKKLYWYKVMSSVLQMQDDGREINQALKSITFEDVAFWLSESWEEVASSTIKKSWCNIWPEKKGDSSNQNIYVPEDGDISNTKLLQILRRIKGCEEVDEEDLQSWIKNDLGVFTDQEIIAMVSGGGEAGKEDENGCTSDGKAVKHTESQDFNRIQSCHDTSKECFHECIEKKQKLTDSLNNQKIISEEMQDEREKGKDEDEKCPLFVEIKDFYLDRKRQDLNKEDSQQWIKEDCEATDPLSDQKMLPLNIEVEQVGVESPETATKKPRAKISMQQKFDAIKCLNIGQSVYEVADRLGVDSTTVRKWRMNRVQIEQWCTSAEQNSSLKKRMSMRSAANEYLDEAVYVWYCMRRRQAALINGRMIKSKALSLYKQMGGGSDFFASEGWLGNWKRRHGIRQLAIAGDPSDTEKFNGRLLKVIEEEQLTQDQVFKCSHAGLQYKLLPSKTIARKSERSLAGFDHKKNRVIVMVTSNASGTLKLPLMIIGKSAKPRDLKDLEIANLFVFYKQQKSVWMRIHLFKEWFKMEFIPRVCRFLKGRGLPLKVLLIIDDTLLHLAEEDLEQGAIKTMLLSVNVNSHIYSMDRGVWENLKRRYRYLLANSILEAQIKGEPIIQHLKTMKMKDVIFRLAHSWVGVNPTVIKKSWHKTWPAEECQRNSEVMLVDKYEELSNATFLEVFREIEGCQEVDEEDLQQWIGRDDEGMEFLSDQEIISMVMEEDHAEENQEEEDESPTDDDLITTMGEKGSHQSEICLDVKKEDTQQWVKKEYEVTDPLSDVKVFSMESKQGGEHNEKECNSLLSNKVFQPAKSNVNEGDLQQRFKEEYVASDSLLDQETLSTFEQAEKLRKKNKRPADDKILTAEEARTALAAAIAYFERQADTSTTELLTLYALKNKATGNKIQQND